MASDIGTGVYCVKNESFIFARDMEELKRKAAEKKIPPFTEEEENSLRKIFDIPTKNKAGNPEPDKDAEQIKKLSKEVERAKKMIGKNIRNPYTKTM